jgi:hypothetical protein
MRLFKRLREKEFSVLDDGRVIGHVSADDIALVERADNIVIKEAHLGEVFLEITLANENNEAELENYREHDKKNTVIGK